MTPEKYLETLLLPLLAVPDRLTITRTDDERGVLLQVDVDRSDMGAVIGKEGETAKAIRLLTRIAGLRMGARPSVKFNEPYGNYYNGGV